jgi:hypothetical protein
MKQYAAISNAARQFDVFKYRSPAVRLGNLKIIFVYSLWVCMTLENNITKHLQQHEGGMNWINVA